MINTSNTPGIFPEPGAKNWIRKTTSGVKTKFTSLMEANDMLYPTREMITPQVTAEGNSISIKTNVIDSVDAWKVRYHLYEADGVTPVMGKPANTTGKFYGLDNGKHYIVRTTATARSAKTQKDRMIESGDVEVEIAYDSFTAEEVKQLAGIILGQFKIPDATPDSFSVSDKLDQSINTVVTTNAITVSGINVEVDASTTLGTIVKNGTNTWLQNVEVKAGDTVAISLLTSSEYSTASYGVLTIGSITDGFSVWTAQVPEKSQI